MTLLSKCLGTAFNMVFKFLDYGSFNFFSLSCGSQIQSNICLPFCSVKWLEDKYRNKMSQRLSNGA